MRDSNELHLMKQSVTLMSYTLGTASKATGKSKPTIQRAIKNGKISASKSGDGSYLIDPAELHRVFPPVTGYGNDSSNVKQSVTPENNGVLRGEIERLQEERERERQQLQETITDLRRRLDEEAAERRKAADEIRRLTLMITDQRQPEPRPKEALPQEANGGKGALWEKLFGRLG